MGNVRRGILLHCVEQQLLRAQGFLLHGILQRSVHGHIGKHMYITYVHMENRRHGILTRGVEQQLVHTHM